jgi:glycosyltransferase involved in cell wall biosynthesis
VTNAPRISVITPARNRREVLARAVESVRAQSFPDYEHIVIDDGSTDGTGEAMEAVADPRLRLVKLNQWRGANVARNVGIGLARAPLVTFLDSDDVFLPSRLEKSVSLFDGDSTIELAISAFATPNDGGTASAGAGKDVYFVSELLERAIAAQVHPIAGSAITVRKTAIESAGLFDEGLWRLQDRDLLLRLARNGYGAAVLATLDWIKHHSQDSISRQRGGYVGAYADLLGRHPQVRSRYPEITVYMVARRILNHLIQGHPAEAITEYRINLARAELGFTMAELCRGYIAGRYRRRQVLHEVQSLQETARNYAEPYVGTERDAGSQSPEFISLATSGRAK